MDKSSTLIDYNWGFLPTFTPSKEKCVYCQKPACLVEGYLRCPETEKTKLYYFCCDMCCDKWWSQENIIIPLKNDYYFLATKPQPTTSCQNCWADGSYWTSQVTNFQMFGKWKPWGVCNNCEQDNCTVVGKVHFAWHDMTMYYFFCSASCGNKWWRKYGSDQKWECELWNNDC